ncbi:MAG: hypothetical protein IPK16_30065 [Anaerolineales bacterium]|nr:hypothetical protein [Anaerolineales bacterium]
MTEGSVKCWGFNYYGQLGDGTNVDRWTPVDVTGLISGVQSTGAGGLHTCALTIDGEVMCWGGNGSSQLGDGTNTDRWTPGGVTGLTSGMGSIGVGFNHTCAVTAANGVKCWGGNSRGELGDGTRTATLTPVDVIDLNSEVKAAVGGSDHTCAVHFPRSIPPDAGVFMPLVER